MRRTGFLWIYRCSNITGMWLPLLATAITGMWLPLLATAITGMWLPLLATALTGMWLPLLATAITGMWLPLLATAITGMWLPLLATAKFMRQYEVSFHPPICQTTQILIFCVADDGSFVAQFFFHSHVRLIFQVFPKVYPNTHFTTCSLFIAYGEFVCVVVMCWTEAKDNAVGVFTLRTYRFPFPMRLLPPFCCT